MPFPCSALLNICICGLGGTLGFVGTTCGFAAGTEGLALASGTFGTGSGCLGGALELAAGGGLSG